MRTPQVSKIAALNRNTGIQAARQAGLLWAAQAIGERLKKIETLRYVIVERMDALVEAIHRDTGKIRAEILLTDFLPLLEQLRYYENYASKILKPQHRPGSMLFMHGTGTVIYKPFGVVLIVAPYNNPLQLAVLPTATALICGNAVILKPSERCPRLNVLLREIFTSLDIKEPLFELREGGADVVADAIAQEPELLFFTGGSKAGAEVSKLAAEKAIPAILELGGSDPMLIFADADQERAVHAAIYGAFAHDGQHCISTSRLYVESSIYKEVTEAIARGATVLKRAKVDGCIDDTADLAAHCPPDIEKRIQHLIAQALQLGAKLLTPSKNGRAVLPAVVVDVTPAMSIMREELFGPVLPVMPFDGEDEAIALANTSQYGLNASVWTTDAERIARLTQSIESGCLCINNILVNAGYPSLPFGGIKKSGIGCYHGPEGLLAFVRPQAIYIQKKWNARELHWFPYRKDLSEITAELIRLRYARPGSLLDRLKRWIRLNSKRVERLKALSMLKLLSK